MDITGFLKKRKSVFAQNVNLLIGIDQKVNKCEKHFFVGRKLIKSQKITAITGLIYTKGFLALSPPQNQTKRLIYIIGQAFM